MSSLSTFGFDVVWKPNCNMRWWSRTECVTGDVVPVSRASRRRHTENIVTEFNPMLYPCVMRAFICWRCFACSFFIFSFSRFSTAKRRCVCVQFASPVMGKRSCMRFLFNKCRKVFAALTLPSPQLFSEESHTRTFIVLFVLYPVCGRRCHRYRRWRWLRHSIWLWKHERSFGCVCQM